MYGVFGIALAVAALLGQREAWAILLVWIAWPLLKQLPKAFKSPRKKVEVVEKKPTTPSRWRTAFGAIAATVGAFFFFAGMLGFLLTLLR